MPGNYAIERKGIAAVRAMLADLELIWRETSTGDFGIDGHIKLLDEKSEPTGMVIGVQVKSGQCSNSATPGSESADPLEDVAQQPRAEN